MDLRSLFFVAGTLVLLGFVWLNAYLGAALLRQTELRHNPLLHPLEVGARFVFVFLCLLLGWLSGLSPVELGWRLDGWPAEALAGLLVGVVLQEINHWSTRWAVERFGWEIYDPALLRAMLPRGGRERWLAAGALLPAALAEEMLFRSLAVGGFSYYVPALLLTVLFAIAFGLAHLPQGRLGVVGAGALGLLLGLLFLWRWSVIACTVAHYVVNLVQLWRGREELAWFERT
ncbi:MAG: CPBP family glutamic-type intramembrane protease [Chloroflexota bacterium]